MWQARYNHSFQESERVQDQRKLTSHALLVVVRELFYGARVKIRERRDCNVDAQFVASAVVKGTVEVSAHVVPQSGVNTDPVQETDPIYDPCRIFGSDVELRNVRCPHRGC